MFSLPVCSYSTRGYRCGNRAVRRRHRCLAAISDPEPEYRDKVESESAITPLVPPTTCRQSSTITFLKQNSSWFQVSQNTHREIVTRRQLPSVQLVFILSVSDMPYYSARLVLPLPPSLCSPLFPLFPLLCSTNSSPQASDYECSGQDLW